MNARFLLLFSIVALWMVFAGGLDSLNTQLANIFASLKGIATMLGVLMLVGAGAVYAGGQMMGAEMRSRAISWAHALLIGGIIGIVLGVSACGIACFVAKLGDPAITQIPVNAAQGTTAPCTCQ